MTTIAQVKVSELEFGDRVKIAAKLERRTKYDDNTVRKIWKRREVEATGLFLGYRTLTNGRRDYWYEEGYSYRVEERFRAALVCPGPHRSPVYVPLDAIVAATFGATVPGKESQ